MKHSSFVGNFILSWKGLLVFGVLVAVAGGIQWDVHAAVVSNTVTARDAVCTMKSFEADALNVRMKLDCGGSEDSTKSPKFVGAYLQKPGPFTCIRYFWAYADCKLQAEAKAN